MVYESRSEIVGSETMPIFSSAGCSQLFSKVVVPIYTIMKSMNFQCSISSPPLAIIVLKFCQSHGYLMNGILLWFSFAFLCLLITLNIFCISYFCEVPCQVFCTFSIRWCIFLFSLIYSSFPCICFSFICCFIWVFNISSLVFLFL